MNIQPLCEYIAAQPHTCIAQLSLTADMTHLYAIENDHLADFYKDRSLLQYFAQHAANGCPKFSFINENACFIHFPDQEIQAIYVIGPLRLLSPDETQHALHTYTLDSLSSYNNLHLPSLYMHTVSKYVLLLCHTVQNHTYTHLDCIKANFRNENVSRQAAISTMNNIFKDRENDSFNTTFSQEMRLLNVIEAGDIDGLKRNWDEPGNEDIVTFDMHNPIRTGKNFAIYNITACGRASIRGGLQAEYIFSLTDSYIQQIEDLKDMLLLQSIVEEFQYTVTSMVAEKKSRILKNKELSNSLLDQCKSYVFQHLHSKLTVSQIAKELHVHPNYLSSYFMQNEGLSLYQYILDQKIALAKNMLIYSNYSYIEIANYLGFTSQSHLGDIFKKKTGSTLKSYRDKYKPASF